MSRVVVIDVIKLSPYSGSESRYNPHSDLFNSVS